MFFRHGATEKKNTVTVIDPRSLTLSDDEKDIIRDIWENYKDSPLKKNKVYYSINEKLERKSYQFSHEVKVASVDLLNIHLKQQHYLHYLFQQAYQKKHYEKDRLHRYKYDRYQKTPIVFISLSHELIYRYCYSLGKHSGDGRFEVISNDEPLGEGTFGEVIPIDATLALHETGAVICKIKPEGKRRVLKHQELRDPEAWFGVLKEFHHSLMTRHLHPKEPVLVNQESFWVLRRMEGETLLDILRKDLSGASLLTAEQRIQLCIAVLKALETQVHANKLIHCDIKPNNIIVKMSQDKFEVKIIDFGLAEAAYDNKEIHHIGNFPYVAPELRPVLLQINTPKSDIYSLARVLAEIFRATHMNECEQNPRGLASKLFNEPEEGFFLGKIFSGITDINNVVKNRIREVIEGMGHYNPEKRWSIKEAVTELEYILSNDLQKSGGRLFSLC